jgi:periplasmic divalent cation tolerance protein
MAKEILIVLSTFPDAETARRIAETLVAKNLAACANITAAVESVYRWQGKIETGKEALVFFKLTADRYAAFEKELKRLHPYDVPEIIALAATRGSPEYLRWVSENCAVPL